MGHRSLLDIPPPPPQACPWATNTRAIFNDGLARQSVAWHGMAGETLFTEETMTFAQIQEEIAGMLDIPDDELNEEQRLALDAYLEELGSQEQEKVDNFAQFIRIEGARAEALKAEAARLASKARTAANRIAYLKDRYLDAMQRNGLQKVRGQIYALSVRAADVVTITNEAILPEKFVMEKTTIMPDKLAIKDALKKGEAVPGAILDKSYSLRVA